MGLRIFGYVCLGLICTAIIIPAGLLCYWLSDRHIPVDVTNTEVLTPVARPGGKLIIRQTIRYTRDCRGHVDRVLYDAHTHRKWLADVDYERPPRGLGEHVITFVEDVPSYFKAGDASYRAVPVYACNLVHHYLWPLTRDETVIRFNVEGSPF
ncbi:hypothetical protein [Methylobacterium sp. SD274]|uniref:hypothetical protein n=1 Tax=Methylobacterium sp. SD274 TaxID=2782009 RepID=UPI001FEE8421|nr:hypothetical protein [Methylobacterium sp. SD274]